MAISVTTTAPKPWRGQFQTGASTAGADCGVLTTTYLAMSSSGNKVRPAAGAWDDWVKDLRAAMGVPRGATSTDDWAKAWRSDWMRQRFAAQQLEVPAMARLSGASWDTLKRHLRAGRFVGLCVDYGTLRAESGALNVPVGSDTFSGGHALELCGIRTLDTLVYTLDADPLFDGTPAKVPSGPVPVRLQGLKRAAGDFGSRPWGYGRCEAVSVPRAKPMAPIVDVAGELEAIETQLMATLGRVRALKGKVR